MSIARATLLIAFFSLASKILGAGRIAVFANRLGAGGEADIYVAAFRLPDLVFNLLILGTLSVAFIPVFVGYLHKDREEAWRVAGTVFNIMLLGITVICGVAFFLSPWLVRLIVPGFSETGIAETITLTKILLLSPIFFSLSSITTAVLHSHKKFFLAAIAPLIYNSSIILGVIYLYPRYGLRGVAWGVVAGALFHFLVQLPEALKLGLKPFRDFVWNHPGVKKIGRLFIPRILGVELGQFSLLIASVLGSFYAAGNLSAYYYTYDIETVGVGVFGIAFAIAAFPTMADFFAKKDIDGFKKFFSRTVVQILFLIIPLSVLMLLLRAQIVRLILGAGEGTRFTFEDTKLAAQTLGFFVLSLFAQSLVPLLARCFYASKNTIIPVISGVIAMGINLGVSFAFRNHGTSEYFALAFSVASIAHLLIMFLALRRRLGDLEDEYILLRVTKISIASVTMAIATYIIMYAVAPLVDMQTYVGVLTQTIAATVGAVIVYIMSGLIIQLPETRQTIVIAKTWFSKLTKPVISSVVDMFTDIK